MNILYHHRTQGQGAEGVHIRGIVRAFESLGHHVRVVSPPGTAMQEQVGVKRSETHGKSLKFNWGRIWGSLSERVPQIIFEIMEIAYNCYSYFSLKSAILAKRPDFIYDRYALFSIAPLFIARRYNINFILEINDATIIQRSRPLSLKWFARLIERKIFCNASALLTVSEYFKQLIINIYGIPPSKICVIPNAINPARFQVSGNHNLCEELGLYGKYVIGVVGAFVPWHGIDFLVTSVQNILKERKDTKILLVGDGPVRSQIDTLVKGLKLQDHVKFTGFVPSSDVPKYISCMDICIMPDSNEHGSPIKIFEYMAMGKPVIAPRYGPIEEIIQDDKTGILFTPRDKTGLCNAIQRLLNNSELKNKIETSARDYVFSYHTWTANVKKILFIVPQSFN